MIRPRVKRGHSSAPVVAGHGALHTPTQPYPLFTDPLGRGIPQPIPYKIHRFLDELYPYQWYLMSTPNIPTLPSHDLHITEVWDLGFTGKGVVVSVLDDGKFEKKIERSCK